MRYDVDSWSSDTLTGPLHNDDVTRLALHLVLLNDDWEGTDYRFNERVHLVLNRLGRRDYTLYSYDSTIPIVDDGFYQNRPELLLQMKITWFLDNLVTILL